MIRSLFATVAFASLVACAHQDSTGPAADEPDDTTDQVLPAIGGSWSGTIRQTGFDNYAIKVSLVADATLPAVIGTVTYPDQQCSGEWTGVAQTTSTQIRVVERITDQPDVGTCVPVVDIVLSYSASPRNIGVNIFTRTGTLIASGVVTPDLIQQ